MEFDYIAMKNYRQYPDTKIEFSRGKNTNFTVIEGQMGAGKTNILNAITWCLFGKEMHLDFKNKGLPMVNTFAADKQNPPVEVKVEIQFIQNDGKKLLVTRTTSFRNDNSGNSVEINSSRTFSLMRETDRDWLGPISGGDAEYVINTLIPETLEAYFFFDGDRMNNYFKENSGEEIKKAVFQISQLDLFDSLVTHLNARRIDFLKETKGLSPKAEQLSELIETTTRSQESEKVELTKLIEEKEEKERLKRSYDETYENSKSEKIKALTKRRAEIEPQISEIKNDIDGVQAQKLKILHKNMPVIYCFKPLVDTKKMIESRREAGKIPPLYESIFIKNLLTKGKCICGVDISGEDEFSLSRRKKVESLLEGRELSDISSDLIECNIRIQEMIESVGGFEGDIIPLSKKELELETRKKELNEELNTISGLVKQSDEDIVRELESKRDRLEGEIKGLIGKISVAEDHISRRKDALAAYGRQLTQELRKENKFSTLTEILKICQEAMDAAKDVEEAIMKKMKDEIEKQTSTQFLMLLEKKGTYKGVVIDDEYNVSVPHVTGREGLGTLSSGERQVTGLSFMAALNNVSGFDVPLVIDTPLGKISNEPTKNIAENFPKYVQNKQVTLLVTDKEFSKEIQDSLKTRVGKKYDIIVRMSGYGDICEVKLK
jgi:DNA sulfur modification protein DndD